MNIQQAHAREAYLRGRLESTATQLAAVTERLATSTARLALEPDVQALLERLQARAMSRSVGSLQALLTAILNDVFPEKGDVVLSISSLRGAPSLDIYLDNQGQMEDALTGSGGAVDNVLSAGLRYSALMRTKNRRLMVLDEPDCWIKPDRVPAFVSVLKQVSEDVGVQTLLVSHHDESFFTHSASLIPLYRNASGIIDVEPCHANAEWPDDDVPGIRSILLENFKAHTCTLLKLSPGMNAIIGENDLGKSTAVVAGLRAVAYNESDDTCLQHGADFARITLTLEAGKVVEWTRVRTGSPKVQYRVLINGEVVHEGRPQTRGSVPEWVDDILGIRMVDGLDIQLRSQKTPVFLLDEPPSRRAQVLSVGREASRLAEAMERYRGLLRQDREVLNKEGKLKTSLEAAVSEASAALDQAAAAITAATTAERLHAESAALQVSAASKAANLKALQAALALELPTPCTLPAVPNFGKLARYASEIARMSAAESAVLPAQLPAVVMPKADHLAKLGKYAKDLRRLEGLSSVAIPAPLPPVTPAADPTAIHRLARKLVALDRGASAVVPASLATPDSRIAKQAQALRTSLADEQDAACTLTQLTGDAAAASQALHDLKHSLGVCPLCGQEFEHAH